MGCFTLEYNPCADITKMSTAKYNCKYCDTHDGCNKNSAKNSSGIQTITSMFVLISALLITHFK